MDEADPHRIDPDLDPFNPANGYSPDGDLSYSDEFRERYFKAQAVRMNRLVDMALEKLRRMEAGEGVYPDDDIFLVRRGKVARLMQIGCASQHVEAAEATEERRHRRDSGG